MDCGLRARNTTRTLSRQAEKTTNSARVILRQKQIPLRERVATRKVNALEAKSGADKKRGSADLLAKEQYGASETQRDIAALKKSEESDFAAKAANGADVKFCAHTLIESEKFFTRDFAAQDAGKDLARPIFRRKARVENSARTSKTSKADTSRRKT